MKKIFLGFCLVMGLFVFTPEVSWAVEEGASAQSSESAPPNGVIPNNDEHQIGEKFRKGEASLSDVPILLLIWIEYLTYLAGTLAVVMIIVGGFQYMIGGLTDDKDQGKKTIQYAIIGLVVTFTAWVVVDFVQRWITAG